MELLPTPEPGGGVPIAAEPSLAERITAVERGLEAVDQRLARVEAALGPTVAQEVKGATSELAKAITELGRRLALDLPHELRRHRDVIVSELRPPPPPPLPPPPPAPEPVVDEEADVEPPETDVEADADSTTEPRRIPRRRRRQG